MKKHICLYLLTILTCFSCGNNSLTTDEQSAEVAESISETTSFTTEIQNSNTQETSSNSSEKTRTSYDGSLYTTPEFDELFNHNSNIKVTVSISDAAATFISDYQSDGGNRFLDVYVPASIDISVNGNITHFDEVGIRMKGNTSRAKFFESSIKNAFHFKISFKATFDSDLYDHSETKQFKKEWTDKSERKERKNRTFCGLEKLDFKYLPRNWRQGAPGTNAVETYAYDSFMKAGLMAPFTNVCSMTIKSQLSQYSCVYELIEPIDEMFLKKRFQGSDATGDLYKCCWKSPGPADLTIDNAVQKITDNSGYNIGVRVPKGKIGVEDSYNYYHPTYDLKTNDDGENSDFSKMARLINAIYNVNTQGAPKEVLEDVLDMEYFLAFSAMSVVIGNPDDMRYNSNNFYTYFVPSTGKAIFIPYDYDWCLGWFWDGCENGDLANKDLWDENHQAGNPYLFDATIFKTKGNVSYSKTDYQNTYKRYAIRYISELEILDFEAYKTLSNTLKIVAQNELDTVSYYMNRKVAAIARSLN